MKFKVKISTIVITSIVVTSAVAGGLAIGIILGKALSPKAPVAPAGKIDTGLEDDYDALMKRYEENPSVDQYRPYELANISWLKFAQLEDSYSVSLGEVEAAIVKQKIFAIDVRVGDKFFSESLSYSGIKKCGTRFYQQGDAVQEYTASNIKENGTATWKEDTLVNATLEGHEENWGKTLDRPVIYNISEKTVLTEELMEENGKYVVNLELNPSLSTQRYIRQMAMISSLESYPEFKYVKLKFTFDKELNIEELTTDEAYTVFVVGKNDSKGTLTQKFHREGGKAILGLTEDYDYKEF